MIATTTLLRVGLVAAPISLHCTEMKRNEVKWRNDDAAAANSGDERSCRNNSGWMASNVVLVYCTIRTKKMVNFRRVCPYDFFQRKFVTLDAQQAA